MRSPKRMRMAVLQPADSLRDPTSVMPFILRGMTLAGVNSVHVPFARRKNGVERMATDLDANKLEQMTEVVGLNDAIGVAEKILQGQIRGRVVVDVNA